jgi:hypothetical protein
VPSFRRTTPRTLGSDGSLHTIRFMRLPARGPGVTKTRIAPLFHSRILRLVASSDARWAQLFEKADVVSEGAPRGEGAQRSYFGSSDIVLFVRPLRRGDTMEGLAGAMALDPHVRLRAVRMARREAQLRAQGPLDSLHAEITVSPCSRGVTVHVEVEARVFPERRTEPRGTATVPFPVSV